MKYPLSYWSLLARETTCFFFGHRWKSSWRPRPDFEALAALEPHELTYEQRKSGNHLWHFAAWWRYKCTRCRYTT